VPRFADEVKLDLEPGWSSPSVTDDLADVVEDEVREALQDEVDSYRVVEGDVKPKEYADWVGSTGEEGEG
jgi:hypothetical protein